METENENERHLLSYDIIIFEIDKDNRNIDQFDNDTLYGSKTYCCGCIRKYLREMYHYYHYINFDLPFSIKRRKLK